MRRILIVDDEGTIRALLQDVLSEKGYECDGASDAQEAFQKLERSSFDLILMDQNMPNMTGSQAVALLRGSPKHRNLPILMVTSRLPEKNVGVSGYIDKPIDLEKFLATVGRLLAPRPA